MVERAFHLIEQYRMKDISKEQLQKEIEAKQYTNLYQFIQQYFK